MKNMSNTEHQMGAGHTCNARQDTEEEDATKARLGSSRVSVLLRQQSRNKLQLATRTDVKHTMIPNRGRKISWYRYYLG
eukprot:m.199351 g.199351  ORF g.199351 m.199351 type:complete len:79 (+) comp16843_c1_seq3:37-273(+)